MKTKLPPLKIVVGDAPAFGVGDDGEPIYELDENGKRKQEVLLKINNEERRPLNRKERRAQMSIWRKIKRKAVKRGKLIAARRKLKSEAAQAIGKWLQSLVPQPKVVGAKA